MKGLALLRKTPCHAEHQQAFLLIGLLQWQQLWW
jgi:hypothetical protein